MYVIIDSHLHFDFRVKDKIGAVEQLLHEMEITGIDRTCIMPRAGDLKSRSRYHYPNEDDYLVSTDEACEIIERYPGKFYQMVYMNSILPVKFLKYFTEKYIPFLKYINPVNLITDGLLSIEQYDHHIRYYINLGCLALFTIILITLSALKFRREKYESL